MIEPTPGADVLLRRKLLWLMVLRVTSVTILLGSGILVQISAPGAFPIDPFFFVIGLTYALTVVYALTLRLVERLHPRISIGFTLASSLLLQCGVGEF